MQLSCNFIQLLEYHFCNLNTFWGQRTYDHLETKLNYKGNLVSFIYSEGKLNDVES